MTDHKAAVAAAIKEFPGEFGLRAFPGDVFRISEHSSYYSDHEHAVMLYTEVKRGEQWQSFAKGTATELRREAVELLYTLEPDNGAPPLKITREQLEALRRKFNLSPDGSPNFIAFHNRARATIGMDQAIVIEWCGMWLAIEADGHTHS